MEEMFVMYRGNSAPRRKASGRAEPLLAEKAPELICRHPALALAAAMLLMGAGMLLSLCLTVLTVSLPLGLLLGWF